MGNGSASIHAAIHAGNNAYLCVSGNRGFHNVSTAHAGNIPASGRKPYRDRERGLALGIRKADLFSGNTARVHLLVVQYRRFRSTGHSTASFVAGGTARISISAGSGSDWAGCGCCYAVERLEARCVSYTRRTASATELK